MGEFFHGWRRKFGVMTLVMMAGWIRSQWYFDRIAVPIMAGTVRSIDLATIRGRFLWSGDIELTKHYLNARELDPDMFRFVEKYIYSKDQSFWDRLGYDSDECDCLWVIPYWSITLPLTLISASLLLSKPRHSTPMKISEPVQHEGGATS